MKKIVLERDAGRHQVTIERPVTIKGLSAFSGDEAQVTFLPADIDAGIAFEVEKTLIPAKVQFLVDDQKLVNTTIIGRDGKRVTTVEHILAAVKGLGINNVKILTLPNGQIPFRDGSCFDFCSELLDAGLKEQTNSWTEKIRVTDSFEIEHEGSKISISPSSPGSLQIRAVISFHNPIGVQHLDYSHSVSSFCLRLAWARTFGYTAFETKRKLLERLPGFYLNKNSYIDSNMIVYRKGKYITHLRRFDEPVRHKIVDFLGDTALLGVQLEGNIKLERPGHRVHHKLMRAILEEVDREY